MVDHSEITSPFIQPWFMLEPETETRALALAGVAMKISYFSTASLYITSSVLLTSGAFLVGEMLTVS